MLVRAILVRALHTNGALTAQASPLATLRKKTGYTFANCKKALEMHENNITLAEKWLNDQAQSMGWTKATKLEGRQTSQGLIGVALSGNSASLVEVNCETDFVARNENFQEMLETAAKTCLRFAEQQSVGSKVGLAADDLRALKTEDGRSLADLLALMIGTVGENASLKRAECIRSADDVHLAGYAHPSGLERNNVLMGKFGGIVMVKQMEPSDVDVGDISKKICQHVVGMNPRKIGDESDKPAENKDDEQCLIHQEFLLDDSVTVLEVLNENGLRVVDFKRFGCGESSEPVGLTLDSVETCQ